jgi:hypothetical protein
MEKAADFAFKQAFAICPYSPEAVYRYVQFLVNDHRLPDALLIAQTASRIDPGNGQFTYLIRNLKQLPSRPQAQTSDPATLPTETVEQVKSELAAREVDYDQQQTVLEKLKAMNHEELLKALPKAVMDTQLNGLMAELDIAEQNLDKIKRDYAPEHPKYVSLDESIKDLQHKIDDRMSGIMVGLQAKLDAAAAHIDSIKRVIEEAKHSAAIENHGIR